MLRRVLILLLLSPSAIFAQVVRGTVTDAGTGAPVKAAAISLFESGGHRLYQVFSDDEGKFELVVTQRKAVYITVQEIGYESLTSKPLSARAGEEIRVNVLLSPNPLPLQPIEVIARRLVEWRLRPFLDRASAHGKSGLGHIWTRADLERHPVVLASQILRRVPSRSAALLGGAQSCSRTAYFIDNVQVEAAEVDGMVSPEDLEGVEIYRNTEIPAELESRAWHWEKPTTQTVQVDNAMVSVPSGPTLQRYCRIVLFWRKPYRELHRNRINWGQSVAVAGLFGVIILVSRALW